MTRGTDLRQPSVFVAVDDLQPGMPVAEDVFDQQGRMLMAAGTELTERHLRACQLWGISGIRVRAEGLPAEAAGREPTPEQYAAAEAETQQRFRNTDRTHPLMVELVRLCILRAVDRATGDGGPRG
jgi:hypothetical protein